MSRYPVEALLRPIVEWQSASACASASLLLAMQPQWFALPSFYSYSLAGLLSFRTLQRFWQGFPIYRYQKRLKRLPRYVLPAAKVPVSQRQLFLGKGFEWRAIHTQRFYQCNLPQFERYTKAGKSYALSRRIEFLSERHPVLKPLAYLTTSNSGLNPVRPLPEVGGNPLLHGVEPQETDVLLGLGERVGHTLVLGTTRVGKTRLLELLLIQDIRRGDVVIVFDPKGDANLLRRIYAEAKACGREDDVIIFHLGFPEHSARYNPISQFARVTEVANRVANQLPASGDSAAFKEFAWRFVNIIAQALVALGRRPTYHAIQRYILNIDHLLLDYCKQWLPKVDPNWESAVALVEKEIDAQKLPIHMRTRSRYLLAIVNYIRNSALYDPIAEGLCSAFNYDKTYFDKITASLLPLLEKLTTGKSAELISPIYDNLEDERPLFDWQQVIRGRKIVYVGLDAMSDREVASAVGSAMFSDLCSVAGQIYKHGTEGIGSLSKTREKIAINVHADEFNEIANDDVNTLLNKAGGAGFQLTLYTQTRADISVRLGSQDKAEQTKGNLNTLICLRVANEDTARLLTDMLPKNVPVQIIQPVSSATDANNVGTEQDFGTTNEDRLNTVEVPLLNPGDLLQLPKGQAFCLMNGGQLWKFRIPLPSSDDFKGIPAWVEELSQHMKAKYQNNTMEASSHL